MYEIYMCRNDISLFVIFLIYIIKIILGQIWRMVHRDLETDRYIKSGSFDSGNDERHIMLY